MLTFQLKEFPVLEIKNLILRQITIDDAEIVYTLRNMPESIVHTARLPYKSIQEAIDLIGKMQESFLKSEGISWAVTQKGNNEMIGSIGLWRIEREHYRAEIGYALLAKYWKQGIISEAIKKVIEFGFEHLEIHSIVANLNPTNYASLRVLEKAGFEKEAYFKENYYFNGKFLDTLTYGKIKTKIT